MHFCGSRHLGRHGLYHSHYSFLDTQSALSRFVSEQSAFEAPAWGRNCAWINKICPRSTALSFAVVNAFQSPHIKTNPRSLSLSILGSGCIQYSAGVMHTSPCAHSRDEDYGGGIWRATAQLSCIRDSYFRCGDEIQLRSFLARRNITWMLFISETFISAGKQDPSFLSAGV